MFCHWKCVSTLMLLLAYTVNQSTAVSMYSVYGLIESLAGLADLLLIKFVFCLFSVD